MTPAKKLVLVASDLQTSQVSEARRFTPAVPPRAQLLSPVLTALRIGDPPGHPRNRRPFDFEIAGYFSTAPAGGKVGLAYDIKVDDAARIVDVIITGWLPQKSRALRHNLQAFAEKIKVNELGGWLSSQRHPMQIHVRTAQPGSRVLSGTWQPVNG